MNANDLFSHQPPHISCRNRSHSESCTRVTCTSPAIFRYIEGWYNPRRRHSSINYESPAEFERKRYTAA